jgi:hypothetical protein
MAPNNYHYSQNDYLNFRQKITLFDIVVINKTIYEVRIWAINFVIFRIQSKHAYKYVE